MFGGDLWPLKRLKKRASILSEFISGVMGGWSPGVLGIGVLVVVDLLLVYSVCN